MIVKNQRDLERICRSLREAGSFGVDTEFVRERTYFVQLGIVQVATHDLEAILDPEELSDLGPFLELVSDPTVETIVHAGRQDLTIFYERNGVAPARIFDTQIAAALIGFGEQISYAKLVEKIVGLKLAKQETRTDWTDRPLSKAQVEYALEDVRHLGSLKKHLTNKLQRLGREDWAAEEFAMLEAPEQYEIPEPREAYKRVKAPGLDRSRLGVLREVAAWREEEAMRRDRPRGWVISDQAVVEIARRKPASALELKKLRNLDGRPRERYGARLLELVRKGLEQPVTDGAQVLPVSARTESLARLLEAWLQACATSESLSPTTLAPRDEIKTLAASHLDGEIPDLPVLRGWRRALVGQSMLDILSGKLTVRVDPRNGTLTGSPRRSKG